MPTQAKKDGNARHVAKLDLIKIQPYKEEGIEIRVAALMAGQSVQAYVMQAIRERLSREDPNGERREKIHARLEQRNREREERKAEQAENERLADIAIDVSEWL